RKLWSERNGPERRRCLMLARVQVAIQPAVLRAFHAGCGGLHVILRIEMRACPVRGAAGMNDRHLPRFEQRLEWSQTRMQPEKAVEVDGRVGRCARFRDRQGGPRLVVRALAVRHDHVQTIYCTALEDGDQHFASRVGRGHRSRQKRWREAEADEGESAVLQKDASRNHGFTFSETRASREAAPRPGRAGMLSPRWSASMKRDLLREPDR